MLQKCASQLRHVIVSVPIFACYSRIAKYIFAKYYIWGFNIRQQQIPSFDKNGTKIVGT
jgi:hypothetical protein